MSSDAVISLTINGQEIEAPAGTTILEAAKSIGVEIPTICYHPSLTPNAVCRLCTVEVKGARTLQPACVVQVAPNMVVHTESERVNTSRRVILELLASTVDLHDAPEIQQQIARYGADAARFAGGKRRDIPLFDDNPFYIRDYSQCVMCWRCIQVCADDVQFTFALTWGGRGIDSHVATFFGEDMPDTSCVFCGNCVGVCPTGALKGKVEYEEEQRTKNKEQNSIA
jgi:NADH dehydrogenase/NADH:ubiquinone oxidoreductase subunit G